MLLDADNSVNYVYSAESMKRITVTTDDYYNYKVYLSNPFDFDSMVEIGKITATNSSKLTEQVVYIMMLNKIKLPSK